MNFKKSQSGRSMVEMLGVLAIIGVLSVGGIAGYSLSMRRHRANGVVDYISKFAMSTYTQCQQKLLNNGVDLNDPIGFSGCGSAIDDEGINEELGTPPAGVEYVEHHAVLSDATTGVDTVFMTASFTDQKLCQAVAAVSGTTCDGDSTIDFMIKQN